MFGLDSGAASYLYMGTAMIMILIGLGGMLLNRNLLKIVLGFSLIDTGIHVLLITIGYIPGRTAPIVDNLAFFAGSGGLSVQSSAFVDPVTQALVLTAIVIGVGVTALMLAYVIRLYAAGKTLNVAEFGRLKW